MPRIADPLVIAVLAFTFSVGASAADKAEKGASGEKAACAEAYGKAQGLRGDHKLIATREQLRICARATCPHFIAKDCTAWLVDVEARIPSIVPMGKDASGSDVRDVTVSMDGTVIATQLDGQSIDVDPGWHTFAFESLAGTKVEQSLVVAEGEKAQHVSVTMGASKPVPIATTRAATEASLAGGSEPDALGHRGSTWTGRNTLAVVLGGAGLAGIVVGTIYGLQTLSLAKTFNNECNGQSCPDPVQSKADHTNAVTDGTIATAAFIAGAALVAAGVVLFETAPKPTTEGFTPSSTRVQVAPAVLPGGGGAWMQGNF